MKDQARWVEYHRGPRIDAIPVVGVGGLIFAIGIVVLALVGLPIAKWFLLGAAILGVGVAGALRFFRRVHPRTEVEETQLNVGRQRQQP